jgi:hypothetical protein
MPPGCGKNSSKSYLPSSNVKKNTKIMTVALIATLVLYLPWANPHSQFSSSAVILAHRIFRSELVISSYAKNLEHKHKYHQEPGEPDRPIPGNFEEYLMARFRDGTAQERESIIKFYIRVLPFTFCCWKVAQYEEKAVIGDVLRLAQTMTDREKIGALMLAESLRRNHPMFKPSLNAKSSQINTVFELYKVWWQSPLPLQEKLEINPLQNTSYKWVSP